jgi:hypothetical protein
VLAACSAGGTPSGSSIDVSIEPEVVTVVAGTSQPFVAGMSGTANPDVTWSVEEGIVGGVISPTGVYRAPNRTGTYHVAAASRADASSRGLATVTVVPPAAISVSITSPADPAVILPPGGTVAFLAAVNGAGNRNVIWTIETGQPVPGGSITVEGVYTAPALALVRPYLDAAGGSISVVVRARSVVDPTKWGTRPVVIQEQSVPVTISPPSVVVGLGGFVTLAMSEVLFTATTWTVNGVGGGGSAIGTISASGQYAAPLWLANPATMVVGNSAAVNAVAITVVSRFLPPEAVSVQACLPSCPFARPAALAAADFNSDGLSDLVAANPGSGTLSLLMAADSSHFAAPYRLSVGSPGTSVPRMLLAVPRDGGGPSDVMVADADFLGGALRARLGAGDGTFGGEITSVLPSNADPVAMAAGFFDGDSLRDLVVADGAAKALHVFQGLGGGRFSLRASLGDAARFPRPTAVAVGDFDRDGRDDLAVAAGDNTLSVWLTNQDGSIRNSQTIVFQPGSVPVSILPADLNLDAAPDLVVTIGTPPGVSVVLNSAAPPLGRFGAPSPSIGGGAMPVAAATGDFNRDGVPDVVTADRSADTVTTYFGDGEGGLVRSETYPVGVLPEAVTTGDFSGDGWDDVAVTNSSDDTVSILRNRGGPMSP